MRDRSQAIREAQKRLTKSEQDIQERTLETGISEANAGRLQTESHILFVSMLAENDDLTDNQIKFLAEYAQNGLHLQACTRTGISPTTYYTWMRTNSEFKAAFEEARKFANEKLEAYALDMAFGTYTEPIVSAGQYVTDKKIRDTKMLAMVMRARMPDKYGQKLDVTSAGQSLIKYVDKETWDAI